MTRISDLALQQSLLSGFQQAQQSGITTQAQLASGDRVSDYAGLGQGATQLVRAEGLVERSNALQDATSIASGRFSVQSVGLQTISEDIARLQTSILSALSTNSQTGLSDIVTQTQARLSEALNARSGEQFVFGGVRNDTPPVIANANGTIQIAAGVRTAIRIDAFTTVDGGPTAVEVGRDIADALQTVGQALASGAAPEGISDSVAEQLQSALSQLETAAQAIAVAQTQVGLRQQQTDESSLLNQRTEDLAQIVAADIEDVDIAEALSRLSQDQLAVQASAQALAIATQTSLLNFI